MCACRYVGVGVRVSVSIRMCVYARVPCVSCVCEFFLTGRTWVERADASVVSSPCVLWYVWVCGRVGVGNALVSVVSGCASVSVRVVTIVITSVGRNNEGRGWLWRETEPAR